MSRAGPSISQLTHARMLVLEKAFREVCMSKLIQHGWLSVSEMGAVLPLLFLVGSANGQTQASCQLSRSFSSYFSVGNANRSLTRET